MKKMWDKLSKTNLCMIILILLIPSTIKGDSSACTNPVIIRILPENTSTITTIISQSPTSSTVIDDTQSSVEEPMTEPHRSKKAPLSRGGSIPMKLQTERDIINYYARDIGLKYNIEPELIMSIIQQESGYNPKVKNGNCIGLMQVSSYWHKGRASKLGIVDFYDPYNNILLGVDYISELIGTYKDMKLVLMMYSMDNDTALRLYKTGQISDYAKTVLDRAETYKKGE